MTEILEGRVLAPISQQDTWDHIFGSSFDIYSWWRGFRGDFPFNQDAPNGWAVQVTYENP